MRFRAQVLLVVVLFAAGAVFGVLAVTDFDWRGRQTSALVCHLTPEASDAAKENPLREPRDSDCEDPSEDGRAHPWLWTIASVLCFGGAGGALVVIRHGGRQQGLGQSA